MALLALPQPLLKGTSLLRISHFGRTPHRSILLELNRTRRSRSPTLHIRAFLNPQEDPIMKEVLKEPLAFLGGIFAGVFRLDLNEDPLREWVVKTSEAAGVQDVEGVEVKEEAPEEIVIE